MSGYIDSYSKEKYVEGQKSYIAFTPDDKSYVGRMQRGLVPSLLENSINETDITSYKPLFQTPKAEKYFNPISRSYQ